MSVVFHHMPDTLTGKLGYIVLAASWRLDHSCVDLPKRVRLKGRRWTVLVTFVNMHP